MPEDRRTYNLHIFQTLWNRRIGERRENYTSRTHRFFRMSFFTFFRRMKEEFLKWYWA